MGRGLVKGYEPRSSNERAVSPRHGLEASRFYVLQDPTAGAKKIKFGETGKFS